MRQARPTGAEGSANTSVPLTRMLGDPWKPIASASSGVSSNWWVTVMSGWAWAIVASRSAVMAQFGHPSKYCNVISMTLTINLALWCKVKWWNGIMRIGDLALVAGVNTQTIRFYERRGLLPSAAREANGYRQYHEATASRLRFIRASQAAGLSLMDISSMISLREAGKVPCEHVATLLAGKLEDVRTRQRELALLETELQHLIEASQNLDPADCSAGTVCQIIPQPQP